MAFFGLTRLGYQNPVGDKMIINQRSGSLTRDVSVNIRGGLPAPKQLYITPVTENQQYGWGVSDSPEPWTQVPRFPRKYSEITRFVNEVLKTDKDVCMF